MKLKRDIQDISDFNDYCSNTLDEFLDDIRDNPKFVIFLNTEEDFENYGIDAIEGTHLWNQKTVRIFENAVRRYSVITEKMFPDDIDYFEVNCSNYVEY